MCESVVKGDGRKDASSPDDERGKGKGPGRRLLTRHGTDLTWPQHLSTFFSFPQTSDDLPSFFGFYILLYFSNNPSPRARD
jgi:hypothetical protein